MSFENPDWVYPKENSLYFAKVQYKLHLLLLLNYSTSLRYTSLRYYYVTLMLILSKIVTQLLYESSSLVILTAYCINAAVPRYFVA